MIRQNFLNAAGGSGGGRPVGRVIAILHELQKASDCSLIGNYRWCVLAYF